MLLLYHIIISLYELRGLPFHVSSRRRWLHDCKLLACSCIGSMRNHKFKEVACLQPDGNYYLHEPLRCFDVKLLTPAHACRDCHL